MTVSFLVLGYRWFQYFLLIHSLCPSSYVSRVVILREVTTRVITRTVYEGESLQYPMSPSLSACGFSCLSRFLSVSSMCTYRKLALQPMSRRCDTLAFFPYQSLYGGSAGFTLLIVGIVVDLPYRRLSGIYSIPL